MYSHKLKQNFFIGKCNKKKKEQKLDYFERSSASQGHTTAYYDVGVSYRDGIGTEQNYNEAFKWFKKATEEGEEPSKRHFSAAAELYKDGKGVETNYLKAVEYYKKAVDLEAVDAYYWIGYLYAKGGYGLDQDLDQALTWYTQSAEYGTGGVSAFNIACLYEFRFDQNKKDYKKTLEWYLKAAEKNHVDAMKNIGCIYDGGYGRLCVGSRKQLTMVIILHTVILDGSIIEEERVSQKTMRKQKDCTKRQSN